MSHLLARSDARRIPLPDGSVQCVVTSPPYFGLRDYGTATWDGGDPGCDHEPPQEWIDRNFNAKSAFGEGAKTQGAAAKLRWYKPDGSCPQCGARRVDRQIGLEPTPGEFVAAMVAVFREVRRVLRDDGTCWLNLGDSFANDTKWGGNGSGPTSKNYTSGLGGCVGQKAKRNTGLKPKDLIGIPWRVAFALQADGWYLRDAIVWSKAEVEDDALEGSAMPGSQRDRCTFAHEMVFMLAKSRRYYFDGEAVKTTSGAMLRNVWRVNTENFPGSHFAVMPRKLVEPCVKAGTSQAGCCPACGKAWERVVEHGEAKRIGGDAGVSIPHAEGPMNRNGHGQWDAGHMPKVRPVTTLGFRQSCPCPPAEPVPCIVLDCFSGASTVGVVATGLNRRYVGFDLNPEYLAMSRRRIERPHSQARKVDKHHPLFVGLEDAS